jgi:hypothetical protein
MNAFFSFIASSAGRWLRIAVGAVLILAGLSSAGPGGYVLAVIGLAPLLAGAADLCLLAPLFSKPLKGRELRRALGRPVDAPLLPHRGLPA